MADPQTLAAGRRESEIPLLRRCIGALGIYVFIGLLLLTGALVSPDFLAADNLLNTVRPVTLLGIVAVGVLFITYGGHYVDLSIPATMALSGMVAVGTQGLGLAGCILCGLGAGLGVGLINGFLIGYLRLNPIIWTLAMNFMLDGLLRWTTGGIQVYPDYTSGTGALFVDLSRFDVAGIPGMTWLWLGLSVLAAWGVRRTAFGHQLRLTGAAYEVAETSGVPVRRIVLLSFLISSFTTSLAGILLASLSKQGTFTNGVGYDFNAITAVVVGGVALTGGGGSVFGVLGGVLVIGLIGNIMTLTGWGSFDQMMARGIIFVGVVAAMSVLARRGGRGHD
jgi:ribose/xylose/arabinose/galactoside ABC-type transport system permease subunit